jgi:hypothetical protein
MEGITYSLFPRENSLNPLTIAGVEEERRHEEGLWQTDRRMNVSDGIL